MTAIQAVALYTGLNILLIMYLGLRVSMGRQKSQVSLGDGGDEGLTRRIRTHGNTVEWVPAALIGLVVLALMDAPIVAIHAVGIALTLARLVFAIGLSMGAGPTLGRLAGSVLTLLVYLLLGIGLIGHALL